MFVRAIEAAGEFTRGIHSILRIYGSTIVEPGASTLFFVNDQGWALTCRHVAELVIGADQLGAKRNAFLGELAAAGTGKASKQVRRQLEQKYGFSRKTTYELYNNFVNCIEGTLDAEIRAHKDLDIALIHFRNFKKLGCTSFPVFAANGADLKQGKFLCRLGYPFAEFTNFVYDPAMDRTSWTNTGRIHTPRFPIEGMVTRHLVDAAGGVVGFEMSTPGLRGQSGGPAFDQDGKVWGMQSATNHLDLNFDVNVEVVRNGAKTRVRDSAFLHVGHCIHVDAIKAFMDSNGVSFHQA